MLALIFAYFVGVVSGSLLMKEISVPVNICNSQLRKMENYYMDSVYIKFKVKEGKNERKDIRKFCYVK